jgi:hypothetical protein
VILLRRFGRSGGSPKKGVNDSTIPDHTSGSRRLDGPGVL